MNPLKAELHKLYSDASKHSVYQNVPDFVSAELGYTETIDEAWRSDRPRLAYLTTHRIPKAGERWLDFGANTGFFTLSLAKQYPDAFFTAVEANPNHAQFIERVARYFGMENVEVIHHAVGLQDLRELPHSDFLLHLNVLHHAGHDFDASAVPDKEAFPKYAQQYLTSLRARTHGMFFQMGSNWGGDKGQPLVGMHEDLEKLRAFSHWLHSGGWRLQAVSYPGRDEKHKIVYNTLPDKARAEITQINRSDDFYEETLQRIDLNQFQGEFYRIPLFLCKSW